jgi:hypothetical protein
MLKSISVFLPILLIRSGSRYHLRIVARSGMDDINGGVRGLNFALPMSFCGDEGIQRPRRSQYSRPVCQIKSWLGQFIAQSRCEKAGDHVLTLWVDIRNSSPTSTNIVLTIKFINGVSFPSNLLITPSSILAKAVAQGAVLARVFR